MSKRPNWQTFALACAKEAHENYLSSRRGSWCEGKVLVVYNNHPYKQFPLLRDQELAAFRRRLQAEGIRELAYATYPVAGRGAGYTFALVLEGGADKEDLVARLYQAAMAEAWNDRERKTPEAAPTGSPETSASSSNSVP
jgi:hypothetical protein